MGTHNLLQDRELVQPPVKARPALYFITILAITILLSSKGMLSEGTAIMGDMPRHVMNGVFLYDAFRDLPSDPLKYAHHYFARYPALSLGHHPLLLPIAEVPAFALAGISIFSSRLVIVGFALIAVVFWFLLIRSLYGPHVAFLSSLLFITSHMVVFYSRVTMSEMSALAFLMLTVYYFHKSTRTKKIADVAICSLSMVLGLYAKVLLVFLIPLLLASLLMKKPFQKLREKTAWSLTALLLLLFMPLMIVTVNVAKENISWVFQNPKDYLSFTWLAAYPKIVWRLQLVPPVFLLSMLGLIMALVNRGKREPFFLLWILFLYLELIIIGPGDGRYSIYWIPPLCLFAALVPEFTRPRVLKIGLFLALAGSAGYQTYQAARMKPEYIDGYEEAARFIVNAKADNVLYSASFDSGYFVFFIRKYDSEKRTVVLRSDKLLATSQLASIVQEKVSSVSEIHSILQTFGIRYVVIEDRKSPSRALELLREEVRKDRFILRKTIPIRSNASELQNVNLSIYEYADRKDADPNAVIRIDIPLMRKEIAVRLSELNAEGR